MVCMHKFDSVSTTGIMNYLREDMVQIMYAPLEDSVIVIKKMHSCTRVHVLLMV